MRIPGRKIGYLVRFQPYKSPLVVPMSTGAGALKDTDICDHALDVLSSAGAGLRRVVILGRRGHVQASFTIKVKSQECDPTMGGIVFMDQAVLATCEKRAYPEKRIPAYCICLTPCVL